MTRFIAVLILLTAIGVQIVMAEDAQPISAVKPATGSVVTYPVPDAVTECPYAVTVDGKAVPIEKAGAYNGAYYARIAFRGSVRAKVQVKATAATSITLKPERFRTNLEGRGGAIYFDVTKPGPRVVTVICGSKELWPLILFADSLDGLTQPGIPRQIYYARKYAGSKRLETAGIQQLLDKCAAEGGGVVQFDPGIYRTGPLYIRDNTHVHLAPGSLIVGSTDPADYPFDRKSNKYDSRCPTANAPALINFAGCKNSSITGQGVIDGMGHIVRDEHGQNVSLMRVIDSENVHVDDVVLRNSPSWTVHIFASKKVDFDNVRIVNDWTVGNTDGINPDCSQDVTISHYFGYCGDDAVAIKTTSASDKLQGSKNVTVKDCTVMTRKTAFKIGTETRKDISDVLFERCEAISSSRGIGEYMRDGATISNVTYRDMRLDLMEYPSEGSSGSPFTMVIEKRDGIGKIKNVTYERVFASVPYGSGLSGDPTSKIEGVTFKDCELEIRNRWIKLRKSAVLDLSNCRDVRLLNFKVRWNEDIAILWDGFLKEKDCDGVVVEGLQESRKTK